MEQTKNKSSSFLIQGSILAAASILSRLIGLIYRIPLNNIIGDEGAGIYANAFKIYNICLILSCYSIPTAVSRLVATKIEKKEHRNAYRIFLCAMFFSVTVGVIFTCLLYFGADFIAVRFFSSESLVLPIRILAPNILIFSIMGVLRGLFQGKNTMLPTSISQILEQIVNAIVSIWAAYCFMMAHSASEQMAAYGAAGGTLGTVIGSVMGLLFLAFIFVVYRPTLMRRLRRDRSGECESYQESFRLLIVTIVPIILSQAVYQISGLLDNALFQKIMSSKGFDEVYRNEMLGIYSGKYELLTNVPIAIATAIGVAIVPSVAASMTRKNYGEVKRKIHAAIKFNMLVAIPSAVGLGVLAKPIISLLFSRSAADSMDLAAALLQVGSIAVVLVALSTTSNAILQSLNKLNIPVIHSSIALVIHLVIVAFLLKFTNLGLYALVIGYILFALIVSALNWRYISNHFDYKQEVIRSFVMPFMASVVMGIVTFVSYYGTHKVLRSNLLATLISIFLSVVVYFVLLIFMRAINEKELGSLPKGERIIELLKKIHLL